MSIETIAIASAVASTVIGAGTSAYGIIEQKSAQKDVKKARELEARRMEIEERRRRRQEIRQKRIVAATVQNYAAQTGSGSSSGPQGGLTSLSAQLGANQGFSSAVGNINRNITALNQSASDKIGRANQVNAFGSIVGSGLSFFGANANNFFGEGSNDKNNSTGAGNYLNITGSNNSFLSQYQPY